MAYSKGHNRSQPFETLFLEPRSHLLSHIGLEIPCVQESLSPAFRAADGHWMRVSKG